MLEPGSLLVAVFAGDREEPCLDTDSFFEPAAPESHAFTPHFFECHCATNGMDGPMYVEPPSTASHALCLTCLVLTCTHARSPRHRTP